MKGHLRSELELMGCFKSRKKTSVHGLLVFIGFQG